MIPDPPDDDPDYAPDDGLPLLASETPTVDASNVKDVRRRARTKAQTEQQAKEFWQQVFASDVGRREMWAILAVCHPFETKYGVGPNGFPNAQATFGYMAEQQLGLGLFLRWQQIAPVGIKLMLDENDPRFMKPRRQPTAKKQT